MHEACKNRGGSDENKAWREWCEAEADKWIGRLPQTKGLRVNWDMDFQYMLPTEGSSTSTTIPKPPTEPPTDQQLEIGTLMFWEK